MEASALRQENKRKIHPQIFALWIAMGSIIMLFGAWTSAYIVKQAAGDWLEFPMPNQFYFSTAVIMLSSITLHLAYLAYKNGHESRYKTLILTTFILGISFIVLQYNGWITLHSYGVDFKANVSGSFFYLITGGHAMHMIGGIGALMVCVLNAFAIPFSYSELRRHKIELVLHYWHFVGVLWLYLLIFLLTIK